MAGKRPRLTVLSRAYCHLCDEMIEQLRALRAESDFELEVRDVDENPTLETRFGERVPVLLAEGHELCHYRLDLPALNAWLGKFR